ncbi:MAG: hypothetical protein E7218_07200 [Anaerofustis stercorihominis]|nr:hypothetical protein [Anaerofustis stercorihominis]
MKILGCSMILLASFALSGQVYKKYERDVSHCAVLMDIFTDMKGLFMYAPMDIYNICRRYCAEKFSPFNKVFSRCVESDDEFLPVLARELDAVSYIDTDISGIVYSAMESICDSSREGALGQIEILLDRISILEEQKRMLKETKGKMYKKLSLTGGVFVCILLW